MGFPRQKVVLFLSVTAMILTAGMYNKLLIFDGKIKSMSKIVQTFDMNSGNHGNQDCNTSCAVTSTSSTPYFEKTTTRPKIPKRILFYNPVHWWIDWVQGQWESTELFRNCPISNCVISRDRSLIKSSDAVIFKLQLLGDFPSTKKPGQVWIFTQFESPQLLKHSQVFKKYSNLVNWTMGYRRDADIHLSHSYFRTFDKIQNVETNLDKSKMAVAFISHCGASSGRDKYIRLLKKYIPVDVFGACGTKSCGQKERFKDAWNMKNKTSSAYNNCFSVLDTTYKFYVSFENSLCKDYVTEKSLHMVISHKIVPIVRSGGNHSLFHPPNSVINTKDFKTILDLGNYLKYVDKNDLEYQKYFEWRKYYYTEGILSHWNSAFCDICKRLNSVHYDKKVYGDIYKWVTSPNGEKACKNPNDLNR